MRQVIRPHHHHHHKNKCNNNNNTTTTTPPQLAGLTYRWGSVASQVLTLVGGLAGEARSKPELVQCDATNIIPCLGAVFVCCVVSRWCVCVVCTSDRRSLSHLSRAAPGIPKVGSRMVREVAWNFLRVGWGGSGGLEVPVITQRQFQQSKLFDFLQEPQSQSIDRVLDLPVVPQRSVPTVRTVLKTDEIPQVLFLVLLTRPLLYNDWCQVVTELKTVEVPQLQCSGKVDDVPVVQVVGGVLWKVPQIQFIARVSGPSSFQRDAKLSAGLWRRCWGVFGLSRPFFALLQVVPESSASFRSLDDAELFAIEGSCTISFSDIPPERSRRKQQQQHTTHNTQQHTTTTTTTQNNNNTTTTPQHGRPL